MPRPPIDLHQKVRDLLRHTDALPAELSSPIVNYERTVDGYLALLKYVDDHLRTSRIYAAVYNRHMAQQRRMVQRVPQLATSLCVKQPQQDAEVSFAICVRYDAPHSWPPLRRQDGVH
jgi:hypothetical protein